MAFLRKKPKLVRRVLPVLLLFLFLGLAYALQLWLGAASRGNQGPAVSAGAGRTPDAQQLARAAALLETQDLAGARAALAALDSQAPAVLELRGRLESAAGNYAAAETAYARAFAREPSAALLLRRARNLVASGQSEQALTLLANGGAHGTEEAVVYYRGLLEFDRASAYPISLDPLSAGRYAAAVEAVRAAALRLADAPAAQAGYRQLLKAELFRRLGERELAEAVLAPLLREQPDYRDAWLVWGELLLATGEPGRAREAFVRAEQLDPDNRAALSGLVSCSESAGDAASAGLYRARLEQLAPPSVP